MDYLDKIIGNSEKKKKYNIREDAKNLTKKTKKALTPKKKSFFGVSGYANPRDSNKLTSFKF